MNADRTDDVGLWLAVMPKRMIRKFLELEQGKMVCYNHAIRHRIENSASIFGSVLVHKDEPCLS